MKIRVWGCRGSLAAPGPSTVRYGGNTSCVSVTLDDGTVLVLDAGSGMRDLGNQLGPRPSGDVHILLTHLHLDHLQGLGFFTPLWQSGVELHVWGPPSPSHPLSERVATYLSPPLFPVPLRDVPSNMVFHDTPTEPWTIGSATLRATTIAHQGPTLGFRIEEGGRSVAYLPDHEPSIGIDISDWDPEWLSGWNLYESADVLFHDAQYFDHEYPSHVGWGHSALSHVLTIGRKSGAGQLVLFHHDPGHSDADLDGLLIEALEIWGDTPNPPVLAYDGMEMELSPVESRHVSSS